MKRQILLSFLILSSLFILTSPGYAVPTWLRRVEITITPQMLESYEGTPEEFRANPTYLQGEEAVFNVQFWYRVSRWWPGIRKPIDIPERYLYASFPNSKTPVNLNRIGRGLYTYRSPVLTRAGYRNHTLTVALKYTIRYRIWNRWINIPVPGTIAQTSISVARRPLNIEIRSPIDGAILNTNPLHVEGTIDDNNAEVTVNSLPATVAENHFSVDVPVVEGENTITAHAENEFGTIDIDTMTVTIDTIPPQRPSIIINEGDYTGNSIINLALSAEGASEMIISENPGFSGASWEAYSTAKSLTLSNSDGLKTVYARFMDAAGNKSKIVSDTVVLDTTVPGLSITNPANDSYTNVSQIDVSGTFTETNLDAITVNTIQADTQENTFIAQNIQLTEGINTIRIVIADLAGNTAQDIINVELDTISPNITITSPTNGSAVTETPITITGTTDDPGATITVNGVPVVNDGGSFRREGIVLEPGENVITIQAVDTAGNSNSVTIKIIYDSNPPPEEIPESGFITGNVFHARTLAPLSLASIRINDIDGQVLTNEEGRYRFPINEFPEDNTQTVEVIISKPGFTTCYRKAEVTCTRRTYVDAVYLTPVDPEVTVIRPDSDNEQRHISADGTVELIFPPGSVPSEIEVTATNFQHSQELPGALPETSFFTYCVDLQPGVEFNEPVTLRVANELGFSPGTQIPIGIYNEETLKWEDTGLMGTVTPDGSWLEAQIEHFTPYDCNFPPPQESPPGNVIEQTSSVQNPDKEAIVPGCRISIKTGNFSIDHNLPGTRILGIPQSLTLTYSGNTANPSILIDAEIDNNPGVVTPPEKIKWGLSVEGIHHERYFEGASNEIIFPYLYDCHNSDGELLSTGRYSYSVDISNVYTNETYWTADSFGGPPIRNTGVPLREPLLLTARQEGHFIVNNQQDSSFGSGWGINGLQRLYFNPNGSILLTNGNGSATNFNTDIFFCYVAVTYDGVAVIDRNNTVIDTIKVREELLWEIAITPDGTRAYVTNSTSDNVLVIDTYPASPSYHTVIDTIGFEWSHDPDGIAITPDGTRAYVTVWTDNVSVIDTDSASPTYNTIIDTIGVGGYPHGIAITPDGSRVYIIRSGGISAIDADPASPTYHTIIDTIEIRGLDAIAIIPSGTRAYVANSQSGNVLVIDTNPASPAYNTVIDTIGIGRGYIRIAITPDGTRAYLANTGTGTVSVIDTNPASPMYHTVIDSIWLLGWFGEIAISPNGTRAYITNHLYTNVSVIDTDPASPGYNTVIDTIRVGRNPLAIAIPPFSFSDIFLPTAGESSYLIHNPDNTYTRRYKDGTRINFNENGLHTSTIDRNGNTIAYTYDAQNRLIAATYPGDQTYSFQYNPASGKLSSITDPAGRVTQIQIDGEGNLVQITNQDGTVKQYTYDGSHLMTDTTNTIGQTYQFEYGESGRIQRTIDPETTVIEDRVEQRIQPQKQFQPADVQHLINDLPPDIGVFDSPAPIVRPEDIQAAQVTDPRGNSYTARLDRFGTFLEYTDSLSRTTQFTRDKKGNPTQITRPNGTIINLTYDWRNNLTSYTENAIRANTRLTYNLEFSQVASITDPLGRRTAIDYNDNGNPITVRDALGNETNITWDEQGKPLTTINHLDGEDITTTFTYYPATGNLRTITNPEGETTTITYDSAGNITAIEDALGRVTQYTYNLNNNRLSRIEDALGNITQYEYDNTGNVTQLTDANDNIIHFGYNELGQLISITNPLGTEKHLWYDPAGNLVKVRDYNNNEITYVYDEVNRLIEKHWSGGEVTTYNYNNLDNLTDVTNPSSELQFNYDSIGRLIQAITLAGPHQPDTAINYTYDRNGNRLTLNESALGTLNYAWDALNRLQQLRDFNGRIATFTHDSLSRRTNLNIPGILSNTYQYDTASRLTAISHQPLAISYNYTYNDVGNRTSFTEPLGGHNYTYDNIDQLIGATHPTLPEENFAYDGLGNRNPLSTTYDTTNRLLEDADYSYTYDSNGNRIAKEDIDTGEIITYTYNAENQLTAINYPLSTINYFYDGLGRRIEKNVGGEITRYIYDGMDILAEYNGANELIRSYVHGPSIDEPLQAINYQPSAISYYYISDGLGSITTVIDGSGSIVEQYRYDAFGNVTIFNALGEEITESAYGNRYMFTAREYDTETGLYYYRLRYYDPLVGRFLQEDPVGYLLGPNLYAYVNNNPVNWRDPFGLYDFWGPGDHYGPDYKEYTGTGKSVPFPRDWYVDINVTGGRGKGGTVGVQIGPSGVYVYGGVGYGTGGGVSITLNTGTPSGGPSVGGTISGGTGKLGGLVTGSYGDEGFSGSFGAGWGIGLGVAIAGTYTYPIWEWNSNPKEK